MKEIELGLDFGVLPTNWGFCSKTDPKAGSAAGLNLPGN